MRHVEKALNLMRDNAYIAIENLSDEMGIVPIVKFAIQSDPVSEVGVNGCQAVDMLEYVMCLFKSLNLSFPCKENEITIAMIESALHQQTLRTKDRVDRGVEGTNAS